MLATLGEGLKGTALVISKLKQKPLEGAAAAESRSGEEEVRKYCSIAGRNAIKAGHPVCKNITEKIHFIYIAFRLFVYVVTSNDLLSSMDTLQKS